MKILRRRRNHTRFSYEVEYLIDGMSELEEVLPWVSMALYRYAPGHIAMERMIASPVNEVVQAATAMAERFFWLNRGDPSWDDALATSLGSLRSRYRELIREASGAYAAVKLDNERSGIVELSKVFEHGFVRRATRELAEEAMRVSFMASALGGRFDASLVVNRDYQEYLRLPESNFNRTKTAGETRRRRRESRKAVVKSYELCRRVLGDDRAKSLVSGRETVLGEGLFRYVARAKPLRSSCGALSVSARDPSTDEVMSELCVFIEDTPALDQAAAFSLMLSSGCEDELIRTANPMWGTTELYSEIRQMLGTPKRVECPTDRSNIFMDGDDPLTAFMARYKISPQDIESVRPEVERFAEVAIAEATKNWKYRRTAMPARARSGDVPTGRFVVPTVQEVAEFVQTVARGQRDAVEAIA